MGNDAEDPDIARRLTTRAQEMINLALRAESESRSATDALAYFNARQMTGKPRHKERQT